MEQNFAELQKQLDTNPTLEQCARQGSTHFAYGWGRNPPMGATTAAQQDAYNNAYTAAKAAQQQ
jgi:hypothetical protein